MQQTLSLSDEIPDRRDEAPIIEIEPKSVSFLALKVATHRGNVFAPG